MSDDAVSVASNGDNKMELNEDQEMELLGEEKENDLNDQVNNGDKAVTRSQAKEEMELKSSVVRMEEITQKITDNVMTLGENAIDFVSRMFAAGFDENMKKDLQKVIDGNTKVIQKQVNSAKTVVMRQKEALDESEKNRVIFRDAYRLIMGKLGTKTWQQTCDRLQLMLMDEKTLEEARQEWMLEKAELRRSMEMARTETEDAQQENQLIKEELERCKMDLAESTKKIKAYEKKSESFHLDTVATQSRTVFNDDDVSVLDGVEMSNVQSRRRPPDRTVQGQAPQATNHTIIAPRPTSSSSRMERRETGVRRGVSFSGLEERSGSSRSGSVNINLNLPPMSKYSGSKEEWERFESSFRVRYEKCDGRVIHSMFLELLRGKASDTYGSMPDNIKYCGSLDEIMHCVPVVQW